MRAQIYLWVSMNGDFIIPLNGLATGSHEYEWKVGKEFFESFENLEILDAELVASVLADTISHSPNAILHLEKLPSA